MIISPENLQNPPVIRLEDIKLDLRLDIASIFADKTATIKPIAMAMLDYIICKAVLLSFFKNGYHGRGLLRPV